MPRIKMNLSEVEVGGPSVPPGKYLAEVTDCEEGDSSAGKPMLTWTWEVVEGDHVGSTIKSWTSLQPQALFGLKGHLAGLGVPDDEMDDVDTDELIGRRAHLTVVTRKYTDKETKEEREASSVSRVEVYKRRAVKKAKKPKKVDDDDEMDDDDPPF